MCFGRLFFNVLYTTVSGPGSSVGIATELRAGRSGDRIPVGARFSTRPDRRWGSPSLLYNGYRVFPMGKVRPGRAADHSPSLLYNGYRVFPMGKVRPGRAADHSPPSSAEVLEE